ncbi:MAG: asparagine synthase (glutamine-hydrolyzing) [Anaerolineales bacterium]|nr:asparagine synthase (glutamine-hydrolyzing) [Anaerolineales bacterium]
MCGIVGTLNLTQQHPIRQEGLRQMLGAIRHRGPDQFGVYVFQDAHDGVGLGNARLSIIDLGGGQQPISNEDGTLWIVFNGEIFNYVELRPELERLGHRFQTDSDTEVIVHLYEQYGADCLAHLNGQFAFAIWDERERSLFLARDRVGIRPLHYTVQQGALLFASEMKALLSDERVTAVFDPLALAQIFTYWSPLSPRTSFEGIYTLPPGHWLKAGNGRIHIQSYWQPTFPPANNDTHHGKWALHEAAQQLRDLLIDATQIQLRADVPVGAYLSGGLDSSTITALIHHYTGNRLETFSIAFSDAAFDESAYQQQMAAHLGTRHHIVTATHRDIGEVFPEVIRHTETPILRTSPAPLYLLSKLVQDTGFKVVLTGEGADEFLAGYNIFKEAKIRRFWARQPESAIRPLLLNKLYGYVGNLDNTAYLQKFFGRDLTATNDPTYSHAIRWRNTARLHRLFTPELQKTVAQAEWKVESDQLASLLAPLSSLSRAQYLEITIFLAEYLLSAQGDRVAMAHSVEGRVPFLDHRVVEFANQLPPHFKLRGLDEKHILKQAMRDLLPEEIWRRAKRPYRAPIHHSFFPDGHPLDWVTTMLSPDSINAAGIFNPLAVSKLQEKLARTDHLSETDDMALAGILSTQLVHHHFMQQFNPGIPVNDQDDIKIVIKTGE